MNVEDLNKYVNEDSVRGELTRELLGVLSDYKNDKIDFKTKDDLVKSIHEGFRAEEDFKDEQTARYLKQAVDALLKIV
tara:strand:- start:136 stop:369 length:234 start_codon:yes stop_codon:yes gene_type:complete